MENREIILGLIDCTQKKEDHLQELLKLTTAQRIFIKNGDMEKLSEAIDHKQMIINEIQELDLEFLKNYTSIKTRLNIQSFEEMDVKQYPELRNLKLYIQKTLQLLGQIDGLDKENKENLSLDFEKTKDEMRKSKLQQQSTKIASSYKNKYVGGQGVFIDNKDKK